jgi:hypothetical protein
LSRLPATPGKKTVWRSGERGTEEFDPIRIHELFGSHEIRRSQSAVQGGELLKELVKTAGRRHYQHLRGGMPPSFGRAVLTLFQSVGVFPILPRAKAG